MTLHQMATKVLEDLQYPYVELLDHRHQIIFAALMKAYHAGYANAEQDEINYPRNNDKVGT